MVQLLKEQEEKEKVFGMINTFQSGDTTTTIDTNISDMPSLSLKLPSESLVQYFTILKTKLEESMFSFTGGGIPPLFRVSSLFVSIAYYYIK